MNENLLFLGVFKKNMFVTMLLGVCGGVCVVVPQLCIGWNSMPVLPLWQGGEKERE